MKLEDVLSEVTSLAQLADYSGTFGVGGVLVDDNLNVVVSCRNQVMQDGRLHDPTGHVERQLVDWFLQKRATGDIAGDPSRYTIVSSLEPCMMCAGAILKAELNCVALLEDRSAGVGVGRGFAAIPEPLRGSAEDAMELIRPSLRHGHLSNTFADDDAAFEAWSPKLDSLIGTAQDSFAHSFSGVRSRVGSAATDVFTRQLRSSDKLVIVNGGGERASIAGRDHDPSLPPDHVISRLRSRYNDLSAPASAIMSPAGVVLCAALGRPKLSETRLPALEAIRAFTRERERLIARLGKPIRPSELKFVFAGPFEALADLILSFGAVGSFYERPVAMAAGNRAAIFGLDWSPALAETYARYLAAFPPFYTAFVGLKIGNPRDLPAHVLTTA